MSRPAATAGVSRVPAIRSRLRTGCRLAVIAAVLVLAAGCDATGKPSSPAGEGTSKPTRDLDKQVDSVMQDFKNE